MRRLPYVIDNDRHKMADILNQVLEDHRDLAMDVASAYFNVRGYGLLRDRLRQLGSLRLLLGAEPLSVSDLGLKPTAAAIQAALRGDLSAEPYRLETIELVEDLIRFSRDERVQVRLYDERFLHAKCYLFYGDPKGGPLLDRFRPVLGIVGSSNFTGPGLSTNRELNLVHKGIIPEEEVNDEKARAAALSHYGEKAAEIEIGDDDPYAGGQKPRVSKKISFESKRVIKGEVGASAIWELAEWFDHQWGLSRDYKQELIDLLDNSKFGTKEYTPYEVYLKALFEHFRADLEAVGDESADRYSLDLAEFQTDAVSRARRILAKHDGVMVCDSVGLGKTWIALQLLLDYAYHKRWHALVVCPASLRPMWEASKRTTKMHFDILGQEILGREECDVEPYGKYDFVVVDESHNFRSKGSGRYENLSRLLALNGGRGAHGYRKKIVLLTATPINNSVMDLHAQVEILTRGDNAFFAGAGIGRLDRYFWDARRALAAGTATVGRALYNLLDEIVIRRTRQYIRKTYPEATVNGKKVNFPERKLVTVRYDLEGTYAGIYEQIVRTIEQLKLAPYELESYKANPEERDKNVVQRGQALVGIFKSRYLKRLESSVAAFRISVFRLMEYLLTFRHYILDNVLLEPGDFWKLLGTIDKDLEDDAQAQESEVEEDGESEPRPRSRHQGIEASLKANRLLKRATRLPAGTYELQKLNDALDADLRALDQAYDLVRPIKPQQDKKLVEIKEILAKDLAGKKVLIFTSFKDTAKYLFKQMSEDAEYVQRLGGRRMRVIHGGSDAQTRRRLVQGFAPKSNDKAEWVGTDKEVDILISTDVLSEGQNLQDCAYLLNYDLHWNPTRMIQRAGRIDRIGTDFDTLFVRNCFPDAGLERLLGLVRSLQAKIKTIDATVGLDASVLGEAINPKVFNTLKRIEGEDETVIDEEQAEAELATDEGLLRHLAEYMRVSGKELLSTLPDGIHSGLHKQGHRGVFLYYQRRGRTASHTDHFWRYYDIESGDIEDNRLAIAELIKCKPDEPRIVDPALKAEIHTIMERVEEHIVTSARYQESVSTAPKELGSDQSSVIVALQQVMNAPGVDRKRVINVLGMLSRPLSKAPGKELKTALTRYQKDRDALAFVMACEEVSIRYAEQPASTDDGAQRRPSLTRDELHLVCFDFLS